METLMELIDKAKTEDEQNVKESTLNVGNELKDLGFNKISDKILKSIQLKNKITVIAKQKYLKITTKMIEDYLNNKADEYDKIHYKIDKNIPIVYGNDLIPNYFITRDTPVYFNNYSLSSFTEKKEEAPSKKIIMVKYTCDYKSNKTGTIGKFVWEECPIEEYEGIPPKEVLDKLRIHKEKELFDYFTIASVKNIKDPLLFGRINNNDNRYFIAQWGSDILLDDLI